MRFAAFIITYERPSILLSSISRIFSQTLPPEKIMVVDNSITDNTYVAVGRLNDLRVEYHRVGYNAGPAGAARIGLQKLVAEGFQWIHWADDDNPPEFDDAFEVLLSQVNERIGVIGAVGSLFDWNTGLKKRYPDTALSGLLPVDAIGGGYCMIVNASAVSDETLPDEQLFFGLEEFDFCQRVKKAGFEVCVDGGLLYRYRALNNKLGLTKKPSLVPRRSYEALHREYYSYRNAIFLMSKTYRKNKLVYRYLLRMMGKMLFGFLKGPSFGVRNFKLIAKAAVDGLTGKMGKRV